MCCLYSGQAAKPLAPDPVATPAALPGCCKQELFDTQQGLCAGCASKQCWLLAHCRPLRRLCCCFCCCCACRRAAGVEPRGNAPLLSGGHAHAV